MLQTAVEIMSWLRNYIIEFYMDQTASRPMQVSIKKIRRV